MPRNKKGSRGRGRGGSRGGNRGGGNSGYGRQMPSDDDLDFVPFAAHGKRGLGAQDQHGKDDSNLLHDTHFNIS